MIALTLALQLVTWHQAQYEVLKKSQGAQKKDFDKFRPVIKHWEEWDKQLGDMVSACAARWRVKCGFLLMCACVDFMVVPSACASSGRAAEVW